MASYKEERAFIETIIPSSLLSDAIDYIGSNYSHEDIFKFSVLEQWAEENGFEPKER